jgi:hypothetical protein
MKLRLHHLIDIFKNLGNGHDLSKPHPYGHSQHLVVQRILDDPKQEIELVCENDDICKNCRHLNKDNSCSDVLSQLEQPVSKQKYNDDLDKALFKMLKIKPGHMTTAGEFLQIILAHMPKIVPLVTHPERDEKYTEAGLLRAGKIINKN